MAGHSKWANIKFRKSVQDAKRGKIFTKLIREISVAARMGGADEASNSRLRDVVSKALKANMKRDTIDNAIKRGAGGLDGANMIEMRYEGYGPGGIAVLVDCLSDNKNRTVSEVRHCFTKHGGNLGTDGSVAYMFNKQGEIIIAAPEKKDELIDQLIEIGVEDIIEAEEHLLCITASDEYHQVLKSLEDLKIEVEQSQLAMRAQNLIQVTGDAAESLEKLIDSLEDLDDVQEVYSNAEFAE
jgi:YebC/PmpR family DNA-binding regulatory protein